MSRNVILAAVAVAAASVLGGCATSVDEAPFDPRGLSANQREAAKGLAPSESLALPAKLDSLADSPVTPKERFKDEGLLNPLTTEPKVVKIDLREAIQRAVVNNLDVKVASYSPAIEETRYSEADARFDPTFVFNPTIERNKTVQFAGNGGILGGDYARTAIETGIKQLLDTGGEYSLTYSLQHIDAGNSIIPGVFSSSATNQYYNELKVQITQPILRDFGRDTNRARITINRNNQQIAVLDFRDKLEETLANLEKTYWTLVQAQREVEIQQELLQNTINTANTLYQRRDQDVNRLQISQANSSIETRRAQLVRAKARVADFGDDLKLLMSDSQIAVGGTELLLPATPPALQQVLLDPANQIDTALLNRQELGQQQLRIDSALVALRVAKNNEQPRLDLVGAASLQGSAEEFGDSLNEFAVEQFGGDYTGLMSLGFQYEYPLGNRAAKAIFRRAQLQYLQANDSYRQIIEKVVSDVKKACREVQTTWTEIVRTRQAQFAAADALRSVQIREDASEPLTPEFVDLKLRQQETLAQAQRDHAAAVSGYNIALSALERVKGTLLKYNNVVMEEATLPKLK
jgi:outer membrane protein